MNYKKKLTPEFKAKVALEAIQETMTVSEIARKYEISPSAVTKLKEELLASASQVFEPRKDSQERQELARLKRREEQLLRKIGQLQVDNDFFASACEEAGLKVR